MSKVFLNIKFSSSFGVGWNLSKNLVIRTKEFGRKYRKSSPTSELKALKGPLYAFLNLIQWLSMSLILRWIVSSVPGANDNSGLFLIKVSPILFFIQDITGRHNDDSSILVKYSNIGWIDMIRRVGSLKYTGFLYQLNIYVSAKNGFKQDCECRRFAA